MSLARYNSGSRRARFASFLAIKRYLYFRYLTYRLYAGLWIPARAMNKTIFSKVHRDLVSRLRRARMAAGLTQAQVAKKLKKPQSFVARFESGQRRIDVVELSYVAEIYGCTLADILVDAPARPKRRRRSKRSLS